MNLTDPTGTTAARLGAGLGAAFGMPAVGGLLGGAIGSVISGLTSRGGSSGTINYSSPAVSGSTLTPRAVSGTTKPTARSTQQGLLSNQVVQEISGYLNNADLGKCEETYAEPLRQVLHAELQYRTGAIDAAGAYAQQTALLAQVDQFAVKGAALQSAVGVAHTTQVQQQQANYRIQHPNEQRVFTFYNPNLGWMRYDSTKGNSELLQPIPLGVLADYPKYMIGSMVGVGATAAAATAAPEAAAAAAGDVKALGPVVLEYGPKAIQFGTGFAQGWTGTPAVGQTPLQQMGYMIARYAKQLFGWFH